MSKFTSRTRITLWIVMGILVTTGGVFAYYYFMATNRILSRAEAFSFQRMQVTQLNNEGSARFFYATNRNLTQRDGSLPDRFGNQREEVLSFGRYDSQIDPTLRLGMIVDPADWMQDEKIQIESVDALRQEEFVEQLRTMVEASPRKSVLVVLHGYREVFPTAIRKTAFISHVLDIDSPVLLFDWPGDQGQSLRGYRQAGEVARESGRELARTLELLANEVGAEKIWVMANSLGSQVVTDACSLLYQNPDWADDNHELDHVILTAPDIAHEEFDERFKKEIAAISRNFTVYVASNDRALLVSRFINRERRRGESTLVKLDPDQLQEAMAIAALVEPDSKYVTLIDVTPVNRTRNFHNFSLETPEFFNDLFLRLTNEEVPASRVIYPLKTPDGAVYWVLTRGR
jgi:esterase/lipase superfamily enzyme